MSTPVRVVTCAAGAPWEAPLVRGLQRRELGVELVRRCVDHGELLGVAVRDQARVAVVAASLPWLDRDLVGTLHDHGVTVVAVGADDRPLDRVGVAHRLPEGATADDVAGLVHRIGSGERSPDVVAPSGDRTTPAPGRMIAVWGAPGAPGRTTVAVHLAAEAARSGAEVALVDGDAWSGSVAQLLGLDESPSVAQAARLAGEGWRQPIESCLQEGPAGCSVLAGLARAELWPEVRERAWTEVLDAARHTRDVVIVDLAAPIEEDEELAFDRVPHRRNLMTLTALATADDVLVVTSADPVGIRRGIVAHRTLADARPGVAARTRVLLNRMPRSARRAQECSAQVSEWTGHPPAALLPSEPQLERTVWEGRVLQELVPRSPWLRELRSLVPVIAR